jgi:hypothetical protein
VTTGSDKPTGPVDPAAADLAGGPGVEVPSSDLRAERPTAAIDRDLLETLLKHKRETARERHDFIIGLIDHGGPLLIAVFGLALVASGHGSASDVKTILGALATAGGGAGALTGLRRPAHAITRRRKR